MSYEKIIGSLPEWLQFVVSSGPGLILISASLSFFFLFLVFRPLEAAFPAKNGQRFFRPEWWTDLTFFLGQYLLWSGMVLWILGYLGFWIDGGVPSGFRAAIAGQPIWLQAIELIVLSDFCVYWGHRLQHRLPLLWRFHSIHHSAEHLDWLAAHREHPLDTVYTMSLINLPVFLLGFPLEMLAGLVPSVGSGPSTSTPTSGSRSAPSVGSSEHRNFITGIMTRRATRATTRTFHRSWTSCSAPIDVQITSPKPSVFTSQFRAATWDRCCTHSNLARIPR